MKTELRTEIIVHPELGEIKKIYQYTWDEERFTTLDEAIANDSIDNKEFISLPPQTIDQAIIDKCNEIDLNTQNGIFKGFQYQNLTFSMSLNAQINWSNLPSIPEQFFPVNLLSESNDIYILSFEERMNFYLTAVGSKMYWIDSGRMIKMQIQAKTDINDVISFIDPRI